MPDFVEGLADVQMTAEQYLCSSKALLIMSVMALLYC
jgi:hypothetical protein